MARSKQEAEALPAGITPELLDQLVAGVQTPAEFQVVWRQLQAARAERVLKAELTHQLRYPSGDARAADGNARCGSSPETLLT